MKWEEDFWKGNKNLKDIITKAKTKFPQEQHGGCFVATRWIKERVPEMKEHTFEVSGMTHCVGILPKGYVVDTQLYQLGFVRNLPEGISKRSIFTREEYKKIFPESNL
jgi:hypothetical protein